MNVGILGIGSHLPDEVRPNSWWPESTVEKWIAEAKGGKRPDLGELTAGEALVLQEMGALLADAFKGAHERRVLDAKLLPSDSEYIAAKAAIDDAGIDPKEIGIILSSSFVPDALNIPNAFKLQKRLGLKPTCFTTGLDAGCNALPIQMEVAHRMLQGGTAKYALLVQSSILSRLLPYEQPFSTYFGDGSSAVVLGPVNEGKGIAGSAHFSNGADCGALVAGVPGKSWWDEGRSYWYQNEKQTVFRMLLSVADIGREAVHAAFANAGLKPADCDFFACHQGTPWFRSVVQKHAGLERANTLDTFSIAASLVGANIGLILDMASKERLVKDGDVVSLFASGVGTTWSSIVMRWGR